MVVENNISTKICGKCADCCKNYPLVELSENEINSLEVLTGLKFDVFINSKGKADDGYFLQFKENGHCFFLNENNGTYSCRIYEARPEICKTYPSTPRQREACNSNRKKCMNKNEFRCNCV